MDINTMLKEVDELMERERQSYSEIEDLFLGENYGVKFKDLCFDQERD